jgi:gluconate 2-dehydrogenase gamma chain
MLEMSMQKDPREKRGLSRRKFFKAGMLSGLVPLLVGKSRSFAQTHEHSESGALIFFSPYQAAVVEAATARIIPGDANDPGAREAGVVHYIDGALAGAYAEHQGVYRHGISAMDSYAERKFRKNFLELTEVQQDQVLRDMEQGKAAGFTHPSALEFFTLLHQHTIEGMFSDPVYGGNKGAAGWKLIGFPGAQYAYSTEEMRADADLSKKQVVTLKDLY